MFQLPENRSTKQEFSPLSHEAEGYGGEIVKQISKNPRNQSRQKIKQPIKNNPKKKNSKEYNLRVQSQK